VPAGHREVDVPEREVDDFPGDRERIGPRWADGNSLEPDLEIARA